MTVHWYYKPRCTVPSVEKEHCQTCNEIENGIDPTPYDAERALLSAIQGGRVYSSRGTILLVSSLCHRNTGRQHLLGTHDSGCFLCTCYLRPHATVKC